LVPFGVLMRPNYIQADHLHRLAAKLQAVEAGRIKRLMVFMPPRHGKSEHSSVLFPAWFFGRNPEKNLIFSTYAQEFADDHGRKIRDLMNDPLYSIPFPGTRIRQDNDAMQRFGTTRGGSFFAVGAMGAITGRGADVFIIDDPHKNQVDASSPGQQRRLFDWFASVAETRLTPSGAIVLIQTRWHEGDLAGRILASPDADKWEVLSLPAISPDNKALWPEHWPLENLLAKKQTLGTREFEALYQQNPRPAEGTLIQRAWLRFWKQLPKLNQFEIHWDLSFKGTDRSDFVVGQLWGKQGAERFLIDQVRDRMDFPTTIQAIRAFKAKHQSKAKMIPIVVEDKANGPAAIATLKRELQGVIAYQPEVSKELRLKSVSPMFEAGNVLIPDPSLANWVNDYIEELVGFPNMAHDDQVDVTTQALLRMSDGGGYSLQKMVHL